MQELLRLLADSEFHSGEELGQTLGVTRAAVWKKLKKLDELGISLHSVKGRGYRLPEKLDLLVLDKMKGLKIPAYLTFKTESTNTDVRTLMTNGTKLPFLSVTEIQTQGRGRRGRQWQGGIGRNILMSIGWHFDQGVSVVEGLSLAIGVAVSRVLKGHGVSNVSLKWPNDVLVNNKKICGILLEMVSDQDSCDVVIGLGLNVSVAQVDMSAVDQPWTDLKTELGQAPSRNSLVVALTNSITEVCHSFANGDGLTPYLTEWMQQDALKRQKVKLIVGNREEYGIARGIDASGALLFEQEGSIRALHGGEVSVRKE